MSAAVDEAVDTSDLDVLGEDHRACFACYPEYLPFGAPFVAICGQDAIARGVVTFEDGGCPRCDALSREPCLRCGA